MQKNKLDEFDGKAYSEHLLLFIDILGYSELMLSNNEVKKNNILELQNNALISDKAGHYKKVTHSHEKSTIYTKPLTALLSDTVIYSFPLQDLENCGDQIAFVNAYRYCVKRIRDIHSLLLTKGMLMRGALVIGKTVNHEGLAYGEALAKANELQKGKNPFVYFDSDVISFMKSRLFGDNIHDFLREDGQNSEYYFDYMDSIMYGSLGDKRQELFKLINSHIEQININLEATAKNESAHKKWRKAANYYSEKISKLNKEISNFPSTGNDLYSGKMIDKIFTTSN